MVDHRETFNVLRRSKGSCERCGCNVSMKRLTCQDHGEGMQAVCHKCNRSHNAKVNAKSKKGPKQKQKKQKQKKGRKYKGHKYWESYQQYLNSKTWKKKRERKLRQVGYKCEFCSATHNLHVHHLTYKRVYQEPLSDLQVLCGDNCHPAEHEDKGFFGQMSHEFMDIVAE